MLKITIENTKTNMTIWRDYSDVDFSQRDDEEIAKQVREMVEAVTPEDKPSF